MTLIDTSYTLYMQVAEGRSVTYPVRATTAHHDNTIHQGHMYQSVSEPLSQSKGLDQVSCCVD